MIDNYTPAGRTFDRADQFTCTNCEITYPDSDRANPGEVSPLCGDCYILGRPA